jgi:type IV secretion system protein VirB6
LQKGEIGMLLTALIITMPTVAAALWQGDMGSFMHFFAFKRRRCVFAGAAGQPADSYTPPRVASNDAATQSPLMTQRTSSTAQTTPASG